MKKRILVLAICSVAFISIQAQAKKESVVELINLMQQNEMIDKTFSSILEPIRYQISKSGKDEATIEKNKAIFDKVMAKSKEMVKDMINNEMVTIYQKYFTDKEIKSMITFYKTPAGQKFIQVMPDMQKDMMQIMLNKYIPQLQESIKAEVKP